MDINKLYSDYFDDRRMSDAYQREEEYWEDLFHYLDICLTIGFLSRVSIANSNNEVKIDSLHLRGFAITLDEILCELSKENATDRLLFPDKEVKNVLKRAYFHINNRILFTKKAEEFKLFALSRQFGLTEFERFLLLLSMTCYDKKYEPILMYLQGDVRLKQATLQLAVSLYELGDTLKTDQLAKAVANEGILFQYFLEVRLGDDLNPLSQMVCMRKRVYTFLLGYNHVSRDLEEFVTFYHAKEEITEPQIRRTYIDKVKIHMQQGLMKQERKGNVIQIYGEAGIGKKYVLKRAAYELQCNLLFVSLPKILRGNLSEILMLIKKIELESILMGAIVCFIGVESDESEEEKQINGTLLSNLRFVLERIKREYTLCLWITVKKVNYLLSVGMHVISTELPILSVKEKLAIWELYAAKYPIDKTVNLLLCANQYILTTGRVEEVLMTADYICKGDQREWITSEDISRGVKQQSVNPLGRAATLIKSIYTWKDLVIEPEQKRQLELICNQVKYRSIVGEEWGFYKKTAYGRGVCALLYGSPGTGKTMAVQVIANELGLDLYRIDLSQMVSKYIGETEKNISDLFNRAKNINALLFFDEADAMFAKRSEVKDSHDRNANAETAHLLQKLEDFEGITLLATNFVNNIDEAFKRRIKFMVNFSFPTAKERLDLWKKILPAEVPCGEELDFEFFAEKFELSGSSIKEIITNGAFISASENSQLFNRHMVEAIKLNFAKYGKILTNRDFGYLVAEL